MAGDATVKISIDEPRRFQTKPHELMRSAEFRAFAQKWLGFDPADEDDLMCFELTVKINHPVTYSLVRAAIGQS